LKSLPLDHPKKIKKKPGQIIIKPQKIALSPGNSILALPGNIDEIDRQPAGSDTHNFTGKLHSPKTQKEFPKNQGTNKNHDTLAGFHQFHQTTGKFSAVSQYPPRVTQRRLASRSLLYTLCTMASSYTEKRVSLFLY